MRNELRDYYESELTFLRQVGAEFAEFIDVYVDGEHALNRRLQLSGFFIY